MIGPSYDLSDQAPATADFVQSSLLYGKLFATILSFDFDRRREQQRNTRFDDERLKFN